MLAFRHVHLKAITPIWLCSGHPVLVLYLLLQAVVKQQQRGGKSDLAWRNLPPFSVPFVDNLQILMSNSYEAFLLIHSACLF